MSEHINKIQIAKKNKRSILIVDDDLDLSEIISDMYQEYGYSTKIVTSAEEVFNLLKYKNFHMILLDINLGKVDGFEVCKEIRKISEVPLIFASARTSEDDTLRGLDLGGDDYLGKPYSLKELLSRTNSLMRRAYGTKEASNEIIFGIGSINEIRIDEVSRTVKRNQNILTLSLKEFDILCYLAKRKNQVVTKEELLSTVWGIFFEGEEQTLQVHIRWIREKIEQDPSNPQYIKTIRKIG